MMRTQALAGLAALAVLAGAAQAQPAPMQAQVLNPDLAGLTRASGTGLLAWGSDATIWRRLPGGAGWQPDTTPHSARIRAVARAGDRFVAVGDRSLMLHADAEHTNWQAGATPADVGKAALAAVDCRNDQCLAVGGDGLLLHSADGGRQWQPLTDPTRPLGPLTAVRAGPDDHWWVGSAGGALWHSADDGQHWRALPLPRSAGVDALALDGPAVIVASSDGQLYSATPDSPRLALRHRSARGSFTRLQALPGTGAWAAIGTDGACAWRAGAAAPWRSCQIGPQRLVRALATTPDGRTWVVAGERGLLMRSTDQGRRWQPQPVAGLQEARELEDLTWDDTHVGFVAVGAAGLVLRGDAQGRQWTVEHSAPPHYAHDLTQTRDGDLLASLSHRTLARSEDGGRRWRTHRFDALHEPAFLFKLHADLQRGSVVVAGGQGSVMVAPDGRHWRHASRGHGVDYLGLLPNPRQAQALLYGTGGQVLRVDTAQATWQRVTLPTDDPLYAGFQAGEAQVLLGAAGLVLSSTDGGQQWQMQRLGDTPLRTGLATADGRLWLVAGDGGALYSRRLDDAGQPGPWQRLDAPRADWRVLQADASGHALWLLGSGGRFARSTDGGQRWAETPLPTQASLRQPVYDAARQRWWMPGRDGTLLRSDDDGLSWTRVFTHTDEHLKGVWIDPADGSVLAYGARLVRISPQEDS